RVVEAPAARGAGDEAELDQEGFDHIFDRIPRLGKPGSEGFYANRTSLVGLGNHGEVAAVHRVEAERIDFEPGERLVGHFSRDRAITADMGEIAHPAQQAAGDT